MGNVGGDTVFADAGVSQRIRVALVVLGGRGSNARLLEADERALSLVLVTPELPIRRGDAFRIDAVRIVVLGGRLGRGNADEGGNAEGECGTHVGGVVR